MLVNMEFFGIDLIALLIQLGAWLAVAIIFAESSIIFFLPGDSFLFAAGLVASQGRINLFYLIIGCSLAGILGNNFGYYIGKKIGQGLFKNNRSFLFKKEYIDKTHQYYQQYGVATIVIARYIPVVRTFASVSAGIGKMNYHLFFIYNIIGCLLWVSSLTLLGYFFGSVIPNIDSYILPIVLLIIFISLLPPVITYWRRKKVI